MNMGETEKALGYLSDAVELMQAIPDTLTICVTYAFQARCCLRMNRIPEAREAMELAHSLKLEHRVIGTFQSVNESTLAECSLLIIESSPDTQRDQAFKHARQACRGALKSCSFDRWSTPVAYRSWGTYQWFLGHARPAQRWWRVSILQDWPQ